MREKVGKSRNTVFFQWFVAPEGGCGASWPDERWKIARRCGAKQPSQNGKTHQLRTTFGSWDVEKVHAVVARSTFPSQNVQNTPARTTFGSWDVKKVHAVVARSTFPSQNVENTSAPDHFWKLRCRKSARRCGAKHISKSKCTKHHMFAPLLEVRMLKKCTPLWREAHFEVKMYKTPHVRATFGGSDVEKVHAVVARSTFPSQNVQNTTCSRHFWRFGCRKSVRRCGAKHISKSKCTNTPGQDDFWRFRCRFASRHYTTGHYTTVHSSTLHYTTLHSSTLHYIKLHYTTLHYTEWHCNTDRQVDS